MAIAVSSVTVAIFDVKYNFHLQVRILPSRSILQHRRLVVSARTTPLKRPPGRDKSAVDLCAQPHLLMQYWRLLVHHAAFSNSSELFLWELILYNIGVDIERQFGGVKYAVSPLRSL
jgi:hypothetical protein